MDLPPVNIQRLALSKRQALGIALAILILMTGRGIRHTLLIGPDGHWRDQLWLDDLILSPDEKEPLEQEKRPVLTDPLPINTCSADSLTLLPGVGPVLAGRIDEMRSQGIVFRSFADLQTVKGIGPAMVSRLDSLVVFSIREIPPEGQ